MKIKIIYIRQILLLALVVLLAGNEIYSQGTNISRSEKPGLFVGLNLIPAQSQITNEVSISGSNLISTKKNSFSGSLEIGYFFSNYLGLSSGIGLSSFKTQLNLDSYQNIFPATDSEDEAYERRVTGSNIKEIQDVSALSIPLCINFRFPFNEKTGMFLLTGINMSVPLGKNYQSTGTFTYKGYYIVDNVLLENLPDFGFPSNLNSSTDGKLELKSIGFNAILSAGIDYFIQKKIQILVGASYNKSLSNISQYSSPDKFQLSSDANQINSLMGGSTKASASSVGLRIGFRYYLK